MYKYAYSACRPIPAVENDVIFFTLDGDSQCGIVDVTRTNIYIGKPSKACKVSQVTMKILYLFYRKRKSFQPLSTTVQYILWYGTVFEDIHLILQYHTDCEKDE